MANEEHLSILQQGIEVWNKWREENSQITNPDLSNADLQGRELEWANLSGVDLSGANLSEAKLVWANFNEANLTDANLSKADLTKTTFNDANLTGTDLSSSQLNRANLDGANLENANLSDANLEAAKIDLANITNANMQGVSLSESDENETVEDDRIVEFSKEEPETVAKESTEDTPKKRSNLKWVIAASVLILAAAIYFVWGSLHHDVLIVVSKSANPYVYFDEELLSPSGEEGDDYHYFLKDQYRGGHKLKVFATQLKDLTTADFVRYKLYEKTINVDNIGEVQKHQVKFDTLYSITHIADGKIPNINPEGTKVVYVKAKPAGTKGQFSKDLYIYDVKKKEETRIALKDKTIYGAHWEWDRPYLRNNDDHIFLSAYSYKSRNSYIYIIDAKSGIIKRIPINLRKNYLKYLPLKEPQGVLVENKIYGLSGKHKKSFNFEAPFKDEVFYAGNNGFMFLRDKKSEGSRSFRLECTYINLEKMQAKVLFEVPKNRPPFLSASMDAERVAVSDYSGITVQFFSTIKLWSDNEFAPLTNEFVDGERDYSDGTKLHKTEACADGLVQNIVFEYENKVYLIHIPTESNIEDLVKANMKENVLSYAGGRVLKDEG